MELRGRTSRTRVCGYLAPEEVEMVLCSYRKGHIVRLCTSLPFATLLAKTPRQPESLPLSVRFERNQLLSVTANQ
jgi:hypothetical protein